MITLTFKDFADGNYDDSGDYQLYVVRDENQVYYVGISERNIWNRWFGSFGRMWETRSGKWQGYDPISREIIDHMPQSLNYLIDLWTIDDCAEFFTEHSIAFRRDLRSLEQIMIDMLKPCLNVMGNSHERDPHPDEYNERAAAQRRVIKAAFGET